VKLKTELLYFVGFDVLKAIKAINPLVELCVI
jgi:hypothetical protein